jgi:hypothetical protein
MTESEDRALLMEAANYVEIQMIKGLLKDAGIPCVVEGPDFDMAELGRAAHDMIRGQSIYVPASALERAKAVVEAAWGDTPEGAEG